MGLHRSAAGVLTLTLVVVTLAYENVFINLRQRQVIGFSEFITFLEPIEDDIAKENLNVTTIYNTKTDTSEDLLCSAKALLKIDMSGPFSGVALQLSYSRPRLWTFHMSDSIFARGYGESELNAGAELHIFNRQMRIYSSRDPGYKEASIDGDNLLRTVDNVIQKRSRVKLDLTESSVSWDVNTNKSDNSIQSRYLFHWKNQSRRYLYLGLNRAVGMPIRQGNGLCSVTIIFPNTRDRRDHCTTGSHNCDKNAVCRPKKTNFRCICKAGFRGNGQHCIDIDECSTENVNCVHKCENTMGSYRCACHPGFKLEQNGFNCIDVDECALSNGGCEQQCANTIGSFQCLCDTKFRLAADGYSCVRTTPNSYDRCGELACDQGCDAIMGLCYCETGYTLLPDGKICVTDTCAVANGGCQHTCLNTPAGPICACASGYHLDIDGKSCEASCLVNNGGCDHQCEQNSGEVYCSCQPGYRLGGDQHSCHDIDECEEKGGECQFACRNLDGDYECYCPVGYLLHPNQHSCIDVDECEFQSACEHTCINTPGSYYCECRPGYTLLSGGRCARETECSMANGNCQRGCDDFLNGHKCTCPSHSLLHPNGKDCIRMKSCNVEDNSVYQVDNSAMCYSHSKGLKCAIECRNGLDMKFRPPGSFQFICAHRNNCDKRTSQPLLLRFIVDSCNVSSWLQPAKTELQSIIVATLEN